MRITAFIYIFLFAVSPLFAEVKPSTTTASAKTSTTTAELPVSDNFIDRSQFHISNALSNTVGWFDHFFTPPREEIETNDSFLRVIGNFAWINREGVVFKPRFRLRLRVPGLQQRLRIIASGEDEEEEINPNKNKKTAGTQTQAPNQTRNPSRSQAATRDRTVGLQFVAFDWVTSRIDFDVNVRSRLEPEATGRFRKKFKVDRKTIGRFTETAFWRETVGFGETTDLNFEKTLSRKTLLTWNNAATYSEKSNGLDWGTGFVYGIIVSKKIGINNYLSIQGPTRPHSVISNYHVASQYRQNILRPWFFYEIEPALDFNRKDDMPGYETIPSVTFRVEVLFRKTPS